MSVPCEMLLHPELLSNEQLITILQERYLRMPNLSCMDRDQLLELFHHYCVPYGQRKYRDTGRGKLLNRNRNTEDVPRNVNMDFQGCHGKKRADNCQSERLKPPPDLLSGHIKRIKISVEFEQKEWNDSDIGNKRKISVNKINAVEGPPKKKERKLVTWP